MDIIAQTNRLNYRRTSATLLVLALSLLWAQLVIAAPLSQLVQADSIQIQDDWSGLSPVAPTQSHYNLHRGKNGFSGKAEFSIAAGRRPDNRTTASIVIPQAAGQRFLKLLAGCPFKAGKYVPRIEHTDDYPSVRIEVTMGRESIVFFSESQGDDGVPWAVKIKGKTYVVDSAIPSQALKTLKPYLKQDRLQKLIEAQEKSLHR